MCAQYARAAAAAAQPCAQNSTEAINWNIIISNRVTPAPHRRRRHRRLRCCCFSKKRKKKC